MSQTYRIPTVFPPLVPLCSSLPASIRIARGIVSVLLMSLTVLSSLSTLVAQEMRIVADATSSGFKHCGACRIEVTPVTALESTDELQMFGPPGKVLVDGRQRLYVAANGGRQVARFGIDGALEMMIGGAAGERDALGYVANMFVDSTDSLFVIDSGKSRIVVFDSLGGLARIAEIPVVAQAVAYNPYRTPDGDFIIGGLIPTSDRIGYPLHRIASRGGIQLSFGTGEPTYSHSHEWGLHRLMAPVGETVWTATRYRYELELWDAGDGEKVDGLVRQSEWFPPRERMFPDGGALVPTLRGIQSDRQGLLWVVAVVPRDGYPIGKGWPSWEDLPTVMETQIEVIHPFEGQVIAQRRIPEYVHGFAGPGYIYGHRADPGSAPRWQVWHLALYFTEGSK